MMISSPSWSAREENNSTTEITETESHALFARSSSTKLTTAGSSARYKIKMFVSRRYTPKCDPILCAVVAPREQRSPCDLSKDRGPLPRDPAAQEVCGLRQGSFFPAQEDVSVFRAAPIGRPSFSSSYTSIVLSSFCIIQF